MIPLATLFNLGGPDLLIILVIVLVLFGAKKLPELAKGMGQALREFTKAKNEFENEITRPVDKPVAEITVEKPAEQQPHFTNHEERATAEAQPSSKTQV